jgi:hypothetical protein
MLPTFVRGFSFGMINIDDKKQITLKDPVTGIMNIGKDILNVSRSKNEGVWIGKRPLDSKKTAFNSLFFEHFGWNTQHYCFMFDGCAYHLQTTNASTSASLKK